MSTMTNTKNYQKLIRLFGFEERFNYLKLSGTVGETTFGFDRYVNQYFYRSREWKQIRDYVITRDGGCDLGVPGYEIFSDLLVHHMNPLLVDDIVNHSEEILNPDFLITTSKETHNAIHYGRQNKPPRTITTRASGDTNLW